MLHHTFIIFAILAISASGLLAPEEKQKLLTKTYASDNNPNGLDLYTPNEFKKLPILRGKVQNSLTHAFMFENAYLVRFLKQGNNDVNTAEKLLQKHLDWRKSRGVDETSLQDYSKWFRRSPIFLNVDNIGRPGVVTSIAGWDIRRYVLGGELKEFTKYITSMLDHTTLGLQHYTNATGREFYNGNLLLNGATFDARTHMCLACMPFWLDFLDIAQIQYDYFFERVTFTNVPKIADRLVAYLTPLMTPHFSKILHLYGVDRSEWDQVLKIYPVNQLPIEFGGTAPKPKWGNIWLNPPSNFSQDLIEKTTPAYLLPAYHKSRSTN